MTSTMLKAKLERAEDILSQLKRRYFLLHAFQDEFSAIVRRRRIDIQNDHAWMMAFDMRDALALHLTSWSQGMTSRGGLFGEMKMHLRQIYIPKPAIETDRTAGRWEAFDRLFPKATHRKKVLATDSTN